MMASGDTKNVNSTRHGFPLAINRRIMKILVFGCLVVAAQFMTISNSNIDARDVINVTVNSTSSAPPQDQKQKEEQDMHKVQSHTSSPFNPWKNSFPRIQADDENEVAPWLADYIRFHDEAVDGIQNGTKHASDYHYIIFTCTPAHFWCGGTGNRQRAIFGGLLISIITKRIFLIEETIPVPLEDILEPHLLRWASLIDHIQDLPSQFCLLHNQGEATFLPLSKWDIGKKPQVQRYASNLQIINIIAKEPKVVAFFKQYGMESSYSSNAGANLHRPIFYALFRPSKALEDYIHRQRQFMRLGGDAGDVANEPYVSVHIRTGYEGSWKNRQRHQSSAEFFDAAQASRKKLLEDFPKSNIPIAIVADNNDVKQMLYNEDPEHVRFINSTIVHVDKTIARNGSALEENNLINNIAVWSDLLILAQGSCIVVSESSFSNLAQEISTDGYRCVNTRVKRSFNKANAKGKTRQ